MSWKLELHDTMEVERQGESHLVVIEGTYQNGFIDRVHAYFGRELIHLNLAELDEAENILWDRMEQYQGDYQDAWT